MYRSARSSDAHAIAALHTDSWQRAYRGLLPDAYLDNEVEADHAALWQRRFNDPDQHTVTLTLVAEVESELLGFAHSVVDDDAEWGTLLDNLHVRHDARRLGIATQLMAETAARLHARAPGSPGLSLWMLEDNAPARRFYDALGGRVVGSGISPEGGGSAPALRYSWPELDALASHLHAP